MVPQWIIEKKRDGTPLAAAEIKDFIDGYAAGDIPDYQMSALAMAIYFQGMNNDEVTALTDSMMHSGRLVDTSRLQRPTADKHSTGGIGDKVSLVLAPLAAACGLAVPMISGRGLGITGGTLDKLESISGYRTDLSVDEFLDVVARCGCSIIGQTVDLAPADRKLYALRDVTGTVPSIPLIAASIMSKKLAEGAQTLVLDVKCGSGAFMKKPEDAQRLADIMVGIGKAMDRRMAACVTGMNQPLGRAAGNALEVAESIAALRGDGPRDLMQVTLELTAQMLLSSDRVHSRDEAVRMLEKALDSGKAMEVFQRMIELQGGDPAVTEKPETLPRTERQFIFEAPCAGFVAVADAGAIGRACLVLGAGRRRVEDKVDPAVGISELAKVGEKTDRGAPLARLHARDETTARSAMQELEHAFTIDEAPPPSTPICGDWIT